MNITKIGDNITQVGERVRIEPGPVRRREIATVEILSDEVTASHYQAPKEQDVLGKDGKPNGEKVVVHSLDAMGKPIVLGKEFDFIDWRSNDVAFYVYRLETVVLESATKKKAAVTDERYVLKGTHADENSALSQAVALASETA